MKALNKEDIFKLLKQNKEKLKKYNVKKIGLFIVEFDEGKKNYDNFIELVFLLEGLLQRKIDLLTIEALNPYMKPKILKEAYFESI